MAIVGWHGSGPDGTKAMACRTFHKQMQMRLAQWIPFSLVCGTLLMIQSHAVAQQKPIPRMEMSGLNFRDEFDLIFSKSFGCLSRAMIKWNRDRGWTQPFRCIQADEFFQLILKEKNRGVSVENYLQSKGGSCTTVDDGMRRCLVERKIVKRVYVDESTPKDAGRTIFTLRVDVRGVDGEFYTDIDRDDLGPGERRS
jgi:hypothetical protein